MRELRVFGHWTSRRKVEIFALELLAAPPLAAFGAVLAAGGVRAPNTLALVALATAAVFLASLYFNDLYDPQIACADCPGGERLLRALGYAVLACAVLAPLWPRAHPRGALLAAAAFASFAILATRALLPRMLGPPAPVMLVGAGARARALQAALRGDVEYELLPWREPSSTPPPPRESLAPPAELVVVVPDASEGWAALPEPALLRLRAGGVPVLDATAFAERTLRRIPVTGLPARELIFAEGFRAGRVGAAAKRLLDLAAAGALAALSLPLVGLCALLIRLDSRGPVFYRQERVGCGGRRFWITKLRTMRTDAEIEGRPVWAAQGDARVTRVGRLLRKTRMDELPQAWAVLRGDMSLVGPRPERPFFVEQIKQQVPYYELREAVRPGVTGWAQIRYPYGASIDDARAKLEYDLYYLKNRSLFLDLAIIFHTVRHVLCGRGAR